MERKNFAQVLSEAKIDLQREYDRLYSAFYLNKLSGPYGNNFSLKECCGCNFTIFPFRGTCISLDDFDDYYGFYFEKHPRDFDINYLISFCEYSYNLALYCQNTNLAGFYPQFQFYLQQTQKVIETIGYTINKKNDGVFIFVPKSSEAVAVSEIVDQNLSYKVIEYNHHALQGNIDEKKNILLMLANKIEPQRSNLKAINSTIESNLFFLFNNINLRHNNCDENSTNYKSYIANMSKKDIEMWYDETYQLCLLAFLELDNVERMEKIKQLKDKCNSEPTEV